MIWKILVIISLILNIVVIIQTNYLDWYWQKIYKAILEIKENSKKT